MTEQEDQSGGDILALLLIVPSCVWDGFVIHKLWLWFMVPLGVLPVSVWHGAGLGALAALLTHKAGAAKDERRTDLEHMLTAAVVALIVLGLGWLFHRMEPHG